MKGGEGGRDWGRREGRKGGAEGVVARRAMRQGQKTPQERFLVLGKLGYVYCIRMGVPGIDLTIPCQNNGRVCSDPDRRLFWDHVHPTAFAHARLARAALEVLNGDKRDGAL